jgi:hypothetical protein
MGSEEHCLYPQQVQLDIQECGSNQKVLRSNYTRITRISEVFPEAERAKVQLLHLSKLSELIYAIAGEREKVILPVELTPEE